MVIDPDSPEYPYLQLAEHLRQLARSGKVTRLPSYTDLMADTGLSLGTVQRAIRVLVEEGVVFTVPGRGVYIRKN